MGLYLAAWTWKSSLRLCVWQPMVASRKNAHSRISYAWRNRTQIHVWTSGSITSRYDPLACSRVCWYNWHGFFLGSWSRWTALYLSVCYTASKDRWPTVSNDRWHRVQVCGHDASRSQTRSRTHIWNRSLGWQCWTDWRSRSQGALLWQLPRYTNKIG